MKDLNYKGHCTTMGETLEAVGNTTHVCVLRYEDAGQNTHDGVRMQGREDGDPGQVEI